MDIARLCYMAEQIARNFAAQGGEAAVAGTAEHIAQFWDPRMKAALLRSDRKQLSPAIAAVVERLERSAG